MVYSFFRSLTHGIILVSVSLLLSAGSGWGEEQPRDRKTLRVCADPNNLPFSNQQEEGFENKIAELIAQELDSRVTYTWWPQRRGFFRNTLNAGQCDVVMGVPAGLDLVLTTQPYYRSTYVFVYPQTADYEIASLDDEVLRQLKIGVHLIGDDYANSPPAHALSAKGIVDNVVGYSVFGDYAEDSPPGKIMTAVASGEIDTAIVWGPIAGYFATKQTVPLALVSVPPGTGSSRLPFAFDIALGVRRKDQALKEKLDGVLEQKAPRIRAILEAYGVPLVEEPLGETASQNNPMIRSVGHQAQQASEDNGKPKKLNPYTGNPEAIAEGKELYKMLNCYGCHGMRGGGGMGSNITDAAWNEGTGSDARLMAQLMEGRAKMPSFEGAITEDQAWKVIAYVRTLYKGAPDTVEW